jgi:hypothetical protein
MELTGSWFTHAAQVVRVFCFAAGISFFTSIFPAMGGGSLMAAQKMPSSLTAFMNSAKSTGFTT